MLIPNQIVEIIIMPTNMKHYEAKGYNIVGCRKKMMVKAEDMPLSSKTKVLVQCDYCGNIIEKQYAIYIKGKETGKDCCAKCTKKKRDEYFAEKYGVSNPFQLDSVKQKIKETCLEKYGTENAAQSQIVKDKMAKTNMERYGCEFAVQSKFVREKSDQTMMEKFGVTNPFYSKDIQDRIKATNAERYGEGNIAHTPEISEKIKATNLKKYGVPYTTQVPEVIEKMRKSLNQNGTIPTSKPEREMCKNLHDMFGENNCKDGYPLGRINMDCLVDVDGILIDFEYDGMYWHKEKEDFDKRRNYFVMNNGYRIVRIKANKKDELPSKQQIQDAVDYLVKDNHHITYIDMNI